MHQTSLCFQDKPAGTWVDVLLMVSDAVFMAAGQELDDFLYVIKFCVISTTVSKYPCDYKRFYQLMAWFSTVTQVLTGSLHC